MANLIFYGHDMAEKVRKALPRNPEVTVSISTYPGIGNKKVEARTLKLKGIAVNDDGLVFTFEGGIRYILEVGEKISIVVKPEPRSHWDKKPPFKSQIKFRDSKGDPITITLK